ncbi:hypothetical protein WJX72_003745 [[Myrmecia] bisecta]|uniref:Uncharacterized protein n=1 Tax=[Myrmecia] bisecta TaxID=41462 RepID=A0AAW1R5Y4_9CHLO
MRSAVLRLTQLTEGGKVPSSSQEEDIRAHDLPRQHDPSNSHGRRLSTSHAVAHQQGYFTKEGVKVCKSTVNGSVDQFQQLFNGTFDIISTTTDGTVNRFVNGDTLFLNGNQSTAVPAPVVQLVAGSYQTLDLSLWGCSAAVPTLANLSTNELGVDAPDSGFAFSARAYLTGQGLAYNATANIKTARALPGQYSSVNVGGSRYTLVQACKVNATIINAPSTIVAMAPGTNITLLDGGQLNGPPGTVQNSGYTVRRGWPEQGNNAASLRAFLGALIRGSRFMRDPANRDVMVSKFVNASVTGQLGGGVVLNRDQAAAYLDVVNSATDGENFDAGLNQLATRRF